MAGIMSGHVIEACRRRSEVPYIEYAQSILLRKNLRWAITIPVIYSVPTAHDKNPA